jgi:HEAT repeat protein
MRALRTIRFVALASPTAPAPVVAAAAAVFFLLLSATAATPAQAGRGSSPQAIATAISSGSPDAIKSELERAEFLVCAACVDYVLPLVDSPDAGVREVAGWWLARRGASRQVLTDMLARLGQPDSIRARNAADVLGAFGAPQAIPALGAALSNPIFSGEARAAMAGALGAIRRAAAAAPLQAVLTDGEPLVRAAALSALQKVAGFHDGSVAVPLLADADAGVRTQAVFTVARFHTAAGAPGLVLLLQNDPSAVVRRNAAWALGEMKASAAVAAPGLTQAATSDSSPLVRSLARAALAGLAP